MPAPSGFKRMRLVGTVSLLVGVVLLISVSLTPLLGYAPNPWFMPLYSALWVLGLMLAAFGVFFHAGAWVVAGFLADGADSRLSR